MKHGTIAPRLILSLSGMLVCAVVVLLFWPDPALADDCLRDPYNAEDCLRTSGWAPAIAGTVAGLTGLFASLGEIKNTLVSFAERSWDKISQGASDAGETLGEWRDDLAQTGSEISRDINDAVDWYRDKVRANNEAVEEAERHGGYNVPGYQDVTDTVHEATGDTQGAEENRRRLEIAEGATSGVRWTLAGLSGALWAIAAYGLGVALWPAIPIALLGYYLPDAAGWVKDFMLNRRTR